MSRLTVDPDFSVSLRLNVRGRVVIPVSLDQLRAGSTTVVRGTARPQTGLEVNPSSSTASISGPIGDAFERSGRGILVFNVTPRQAGVLILTVLITADALGSPATVRVAVTSTTTPEPPLPPDNPDPVVEGVRLSWFQAEAEGLAGVRIRRAGWANRYLERTTGIWWMQFFSPTTKTLGERRVVRAADFLEADFRALDWTYEGVAGQLPTAGTYHGAIAPALRFP